MSKSRTVKKTLDELLSEIEELQQKVAEDFRKKQEELRYSLKKRRVIFEKDAQKVHRKLKRSLFRYLYEASVLDYLTAPFIYSMIVPAVLLDLFVTVYQGVCFPAYRIRKVKRSDYISIDRHSLKYLNLLERLNCVYCGYFNGLTAYVQEIAARTEQYWCPIKHARRLKNHHARYYLFADYGDAEVYEKKLKELRKQLRELEE